jgi:conjugal transfer ATP-binding protein TraC
MKSLDDLGNWIAGKLGDDKDYGVTETRSFNDFKKLSDYSPLSYLLPYQSYDESRMLFLNNDSIGFGLEVMPLTGAGENEIERLATMFNDKLPKNGNLHIQLIASNKIGKTLDNFYKTRAVNNEVNKRLAQKRYEYYKKSTEHSINKHSPFYLREYRVFIYYSEAISDSVDLQMDDICNLRESWKTTLESLTLVNNLNVTEFITLITEILNPSSDIYWSQVNYDHKMAISSQVLHFDTSFDVHDEQINVKSQGSDYIYQVFQAELMPQKAALWQSGENIGKILDSSMQLSCPFIINVHLKAFDKGESKEKANTQFMLNDKNANSPLAKIIPIIKRKHHEWTQLRDALDGSERLVKLSYQITLLSKEDSYRRDSVKLTDLMTSNQWELRLDRFLQLPCFMQSLPFVVTSGLYEDLVYFKRFKTMTMFNAVNIMPLLAEWKGVSNANGLMFVGRRGQISNWSNFSNRDGNYNMVVAAKSRGGKSFFMQEIIFDTLCDNGIVRVVDLGRSYEKFCKVLNGQYIEMIDGVCINPFTHVIDIQQSQSQITAIVATMAHPSGDITDKELSMITSAIQSAWTKGGNKTTITDVQTALSKINDVVAQDLVLLLGKYCMGGQFETYFSGESTIDVDNPFIVLELEELKNKPDLKSVVVLSIMLQITEEFYGLPRNIKKLCVIDEAWDLLHSSKQTAQFMEAGYRRVAKQNGAFATIVQSINDYFRNEIGIAIYENSDNQIILAQLDTTIDQLKENKRLNFTPYEERLLRSFAGTDNYKECLIRTPRGSHVFRVLFDPFTRILYSSRAEEFEAVKQLVAGGMSMEDAVEAVASQVYKD